MGVGTRKTGLRIVAVAGASFDTSTGLTSASGVSVVSSSNSSSVLSASVAAETQVEPKQSQPPVIRSRWVRAISEISYF